MPKTSISQKIIQGKSSSLSGSPPWIGISDEDVEGVFQYVDGSPVRTVYFHESQPNGGTRDNCLYNSESRIGWFDDNCYIKNRFLCERQKGNLMLS